MFLNSGMAVSTACKFNKLSPQTPSGKMCKRFSIRRAGRAASSGVIYFIPESSFSLVFLVFGVSQLLERPVTSARSHGSAYSTTVVCTGKEKCAHTFLASAHCMCVFLVMLGVIYVVCAKSLWIFDS